MVGSSVLVPLMARAGIDLTVLPPWLLLIALLWIMPVMGQLGGNPILTLALVAPLLPDAALFRAGAFLLCSRHAEWLGTYPA